MTIQTESAKQRFICPLCKGVYRSDDMFLIPNEDGSSCIGAPLDLMCRNCSGPFADDEINRLDLFLAKSS